MAQLREEDLQALKEMQRLSKQIDEMYVQKEKYVKYMTENGVNPDDYPCDNVEALKALMEMEEEELKKKIPGSAIGCLLPILGVIVGIVLIVLKAGVWPVVGSVVAGIVVGIVIGEIENKKAAQKRLPELEKIREEHLKEMPEAARLDAVNKKAYREAVEADLAKRKKETKPKLEKIELDITEAKAQYERIRVISDAELKEEPGLIDKMIRLMERGRADSIRECYRIIDEEEEERKRNSPGELYVYVGEKLSSSYKVPRNMVMIDGQDYGPGTIPYKKIVLSPGWHTIRVVSQYTSETLHYSDTVQFEIEGGGKKFFQFYDKGSFPPMLHVKEVSCEADMHKDP